MVARPVGDPVEFHALTHNAGNQATGGIWRVTGTTGTAVLKIATPGDATGTGGGWAPGRDPRHWNYWAREALAYRTGFTARYLADSPLRAPRLLAEAERDDGSVELWLEDVSGRPATDWDAERLGRFARDLGTVQARWTDPADHPEWTSVGWLRAYAGRWGVTREPDWDDDRVTAVWPEDVVRGVAELWHRRHRLFDLAEALPSTLCHLDVWPMNLIGRGDDTVMLDWSFVGRGAVGEDIGNLIPDTVADGLMDADLLPDFAEAATDGYIAGLRDGGFPGDTDAVRRAVAICGAAKYCWLAPRMVERLLSGGRVGSSHYGTYTDGAAVMRGRLTMMRLLTDWTRLALE
ncbi:hypothetical protein GCM10023223_25230 [Stackebrandtia albiflava]